MIKIFKNISVFYLLIFLFIYSSPLFSQNYTFTEIGVYYYNNLDKNEFFDFMLPKEKFLLNLVENISSEIHERGIKGELGEEIGIEEIIPKEVVLMDDYEKEINRIIELLDEIKLLEKKARQKVDMDILRILSDLKNQVSEILEQNEVSVSKIDSAEEYISMEQKEKNKDSKSNTEFLDDWKYNRIVNYKLNLMKYKLLRNRLLDMSSSSQKQRMFRKYLRTALENYENGDFKLTRLQFKDIINTYKEYYLDDVLFYYGESCFALNFLDEAASCYVKLFNEYPESAYLERSFIKLMFIYYIYNNFDKMSSVYQNLSQLKNSINEADFSEVSYLMGYAFYKKGDYQKAINTLKNVSTENTYFYPSLYLSATCYSNIQKIDFTISLYKKIIDEISLESDDPMFLQIKNNAILKLGFIYFDQGKTELSNKYFDLIPEDYAQYNLSLLGKAWSAYQSGEPVKTLENTQKLIQGNLLNQYSYEARLLAAYSKNILGWTDEAVQDLKMIYQAGQSSQNGELIQDRTVFTDKSEEQQNRSDKFLNKLSNVASFLYSTSDKSSVMNPLLKDLESETDNMMLRKKISVLDSLEKKADTLRDDDLKERIDLLRKQLLDVYNKQYKNSSMENFRNKYLATNIEGEQYLEYYFSSLLTQILQEKEEIKGYINEINNNIELAKQQDDFLTVSRAEIKLSEIYSYYNTINQYEVWLRENYPETYQVNLDQWAYYSGYGISDINFARIKQLDSKINDISYTVDALNNVYDEKQLNLQDQIKGLLSDISKLENQIQKESVKKQQKKKEEFFNNKYFNKQLKESIIGEIEEHIGTVKKNEKE